MARPKVALVGVGSVGGTVAAALHSADKCDLTLVARGESLAALQADGLTVLQPWRGEGAAWNARVPCVDTAATADIGPQDFIIVVTKAHHFPALLDSLLPMVGADTCVVPCMNGIPYWYNYFGAPADPGGAIAPVDPEGRLWSELGPERAMGCVVKTGGRMEAPGVTVASGGGTLEFGEPDGSDSARLAQLVSLFEPGGAIGAMEPRDRPVPFSVVARPVIREAVWDKLVFNVVQRGATWCNVLTTLTQSTNGDAAADPQLRHIHSLVIDEVATICAGLNPPVKLRVTAEKCKCKCSCSLRVFFLNEAFLRCTDFAGMEGSDHKASTLQDLLAGRPFEKDALVTAVQQVAHEAGVPTPYIDFAGALLQGLERNAVLARL